MRVTITIDTDNAAFGEGPAFRAMEVRAILREQIVDMIDNVRPGDRFPLRDANGNTCGQYQVTADEEPGS